MMTLRRIDMADANQEKIIWTAEHLRRSFRAESSRRGGRRFFLFGGCMTLVLHSRGLDT
jgi:hypothetical protein